MVAEPKPPAHANKQACPPHWWVMDPIPDDGQRHPMSTGRCRKCGAAQEFSNIVTIPERGMYNLGNGDRPKADTWEPTWSINFAQRTGHRRGAGRPQAERGIVRGRG